MAFRHIVLTVAIALPGCFAAHPQRPIQMLDEQTGSTLLVPAVPLVFARDRNDVAVHARDYATLVAVEIDRSGRYRNYLLLYRWSTVDPRMSKPPDENQGELRLAADGRDIDLEPLTQMPIGLERRHELHIPPHGDVVAHAYPVDERTLRYLAESRRLTLRMPQERLDAPFAMFEDGRRALQRFLETPSP